MGLRDTESQQRGTAAHPRMRVGVQARVAPPLVLIQLDLGTAMDTSVRYLVKLCIIER